MSFANNLQRAVAKYSRFNDVFLAVLVVAVIALMIMPVPPGVLDTLLALNLTISVVLLMMALYIDLGDGNGKSYVVGTGVNNNVKFVAADAVTSVTFGSLIQD